MTSLFPLIYSCLGLGFLGLSLSFLRPQGGGGGAGAISHFDSTLIKFDSTVRKMDEDV